MTGFGRGEAQRQSPHGGMTTVTAEIRSINSRFVEISVRLPRSMSERELEVRELVRKSLERGKVSINIAVSRTGNEIIPLAVNEAAAKAYYHLLDRLRTVAGVTAEIQLKDLTSFSDIFTTDESTSDVNAEEWQLAQEALKSAFEALNTMRSQEGSELERDLRIRISSIEQAVITIEQLASTTSQEEFTKLKERVAELIGDVDVVNRERLELEVALLAERLDITEEIVRFRSHLKFFLEAVEAKEPAGRKLNFILQEMNREVNTMGSKTNVAQVAHHVVFIKQELEKIREQVQNIE